MTVPRTITWPEGRYQHWNGTETLPQVVKPTKPGWYYTGYLYAVLGFRDGSEPNRTRVLQVLRYSWPR